MADNNIGDVRIIDHPGHIRKTLKGVTKFEPGTLFKVKQVYSIIKEVTFLGKDIKECGWVDDEFVEPTP